MQLRPSFKMSVEGSSDIEACYDAFSLTSARAISVEFAGCLRSRENSSRRGRARHHSRGSVPATAACHGRHAFVCSCRILKRRRFNSPRRRRGAHLYSLPCHSRSARSSFLRRSKLDRLRSIQIRSRLLSSCQGPDLVQWKARQCSRSLISS
jgi:hypothetical protein